ncbi:NAD(P)/FAD-dependent oxidoreductase [Anaeromicropila herbilytica]|uniref:FAD-dependent protein C-terminal domain-containing protein n=1 Tax=Anaeromicropila herbilytica TaxID=2785025 RepID=A0A7R7ELB0_9FIRM|nr:NAD(P)/FAD-dependent oxidoreductase [Anaeromicropila herbilytica]BCN30587.1 hypothetical protein bsdtb5_18820 [Anaeromicropila herbilytica]
MIRIAQLKLDIGHTEDELKKKISKQLKLNDQQVKKYTIIKKSIDARKKNDIKYIYTIDVEVNEETKVVKRLNDANISIAEESKYTFAPTGTNKMLHRPIVVGSGPAGLFCAYQLAEQGYKPLVIERGDEVDKRVEEVNRFWKNNELNPNCNVQFGEGGAGTFSDGKLNTMVKEKFGRNKRVLEVFVEHGAPSEILYLNKPHIGTDLLRDVVKNMRNEIIRLGGEFRFQTRLTDIHVEDNRIVSIEVNNKEIIPCDVLCLAIGHSARDTFSLLYKKGLTMMKKPFAIGVRIQHAQELISRSQYGDSYQKLPPADYKLTYQAGNGRGVYSFCMCPGGYVVNSSSEEKRLVVNGMSNHDRAEDNANSAMIVTVTPEDFDAILPLINHGKNEMITSDNPLVGVEFQRRWEELAYQAGKGLIPVQLYGDLCENKISTNYGKIKQIMKGDTSFANLRECLPEYVIDTLIEGIEAFDKKIHGFADKEAILAGVETRTSSPVRIIRDDNMESNVQGIYPCGEGAGYAGGITSAGMDGIKVYEAIACKYKHV